MNERAFIGQLERANTQELVQILRRPSPEEERVLRVHLGSELYARLRQLALRTAKRGVKNGNVIVLHGIMGAELSVCAPNRTERIWLQLLKIIMGRAELLQMGAPGPQPEVRATGILKKWYAELLLALEHEWNVRAFWFDWRRDLDLSAKALNERMNEWFGDAPVHLIGHSMGGLVARAFIKAYPKRWDRGGRLIMLGTPNHGSFSIPQIATGVEESVRKLALADLRHSTSELVGIVNTFPGSYQMMPSLLINKDWAPLYEAKTYSPFPVAQAFLKKAKDFHKEMATVVDDRMIYVAGYNRRTYDGIRNFGELHSLDAYSVSLDGDGTVPHALGFLKHKGKLIPTYYADAAHGALPNHASVIGAAPELLETGQCSLPTIKPAARALGVSAAAVETSERAREELEERRLREIVLRTQGRTRGAGGEDTPVSSEEREAEQLIVRSFLGDSPESIVLPAAAPAEPPKKNAWENRSGAGDLAGV